jgi:hypothetical protein
MHETVWSDDDFRSFFTRLRRDSCGSELDDAEREGFIRQARIRVVPAVQSRLLATIGVAPDAGGIAVVTLDVLGDEVWGKRATWLMVSPEPWDLLAGLVARAIRRSYRAAVPRTDDDRALRAIEKASAATDHTG